MATVLTPEVTSELLSRYHERATDRLLESNSLETQVKGILDSWVILRATDAAGLDESDLKGRWRFLAPQLRHANEVSKWLVEGVHVTDTNEPEFKAIRIIAEKVSDILQLQQDFSNFLDIKSEHRVEFTSGALVLTAALVDLSNPLLFRSRKELGDLIFRSYKHEKTNQPVIRVRHAAEGVSEWLVNR